VGGISGGGTAAARPASCAGVWVVVDPGPLGGSADLRCAPGDPTSGIAALRAAGHTPVYLPAIPGFVCTIDGRPDPCNGAPAHAYWSYWWAPAGGNWNYATVGAGQRDPAPGEVEGWVFGDGTTPPAVTPPPPEPAPTEPALDTPPAEPEPPAGSGTGAAAPTDTAAGGATDALGPRPEADPAEAPGPSGDPQDPNGTATDGAPPVAAPTPSSGAGPDWRNDGVGAPEDSDGRLTADGADQAAPMPAGAEQAGGAPTGLVVGLGLLLLAVATTTWRARRTAT